MCRTGPDPPAPHAVARRLGAVTDTSDRPDRTAVADGSALHIHWADGTTEARSRPQTAEQAQQALEAGSARFAGLGTRPVKLWLDPAAVGMTPEGVDHPAHAPFAGVVSCSDARVPIELTLGRATNDLFVVRNAGNVTDASCRGSLHYALANLPSVRLYAVIGHSRCGANTAAVDALAGPDRYLAVATDGPLRELVDALLAGVTFAQRALRTVHGAAAEDSPHYRARLITLATLANTALSATVLERDLGRPCVFGVYRLASREVGVRTAEGWRPGLQRAPRTDAALTELVLGAAASLTL